MLPLDIQVNGRRHRVQAAADTPLLYVLRNELALNGPKFGCGLAQCGACTVHLGGEAVRACITPVSAAASAPVVTIEGLASSVSAPASASASASEAQRTAGARGASGAKTTAGGAAAGAAAADSRDAIARDVMTRDAIAAARAAAVAPGASGAGAAGVAGTAGRAALHPVQQAFIDEQAAQCGYCISGMIMSAAALLQKTPKPTDAALRQALNGNLCRCGTHLRILRAVRRAAGLPDGSSARLVAADDDRAATDVVSGIAAAATVIVNTGGAEEAYDPHAHDGHAAHAARDARDEREAREARAVEAAPYLQARRDAEGRR